MAGLCQGGNEPPCSLKASNTMHSLRASVDSVAENGTRHVSNLPTTVVSLAAQTAAKVRYSHLTFLRCVLEYSVQSNFSRIACPFSETLRNFRHNRIRSKIAEALRKKGLTVHEEVHGISQEGSCRRIDMLAIPPGSTSAYIIDPTIRFEGQEHQSAEVNAEKCRIYEPTVPFYLEKYHLTSIEVVWLMLALGALCHFLQEVPAEQRLHS
ncbi:hypothetical protein ANN_12702 [Periplaneta americana]|uniref:Uncharacterized protein n=1 Tax=Periplaneta americana TaxID=6978 RepID=A0ABQ8TIP4_PERAM|nr:hypothetical protein ANN_12702 [Periplaneta americana]